MISDVIGNKVVWRSWVGRKKCSCDRDMLGALIAGLLLGVVIGLVVITLFFAQSWVLGSIAIVSCVVLYLALINMNQAEGWSIQIQAISAFLGVCVSVIAVVVAYSAFKGVEESSAKEMYKDYLNLALEHREFAKPSMKSRGRYPEDIKFKDEVAYEFYVGQFLYTAEEILKISNANSWEAILGLQICYHINFISKYEIGLIQSGPRKDKLKDSEYYSEKLQKLIDKIYTASIDHASKLNEDSKCYCDSLIEASNGYPISKCFY